MPLFLMISSQEMRDLELQSQIPRLVLMENAGRGVYNILKQKLGLKNKKVLVVCYHGNNGGDGFGAARHLADEAETDILFIGNENNLKKEAKVNFKRIEHNGR